jgi:membrane protein implicated in regulation of membrane protease activity
MDLKEDFLTLAPGAAAVMASWLGVLDTLLSIAFISASLAFLIWRWRQAAKKKDTA